MGEGWRRPVRPFQVRRAAAVGLPTAAIFQEFATAITPARDRPRPILLRRANARAAARLSRAAAPPWAAASDRLNKRVARSVLQEALQEACCKKRAARSVLQEARGKSFGPFDRAVHGLTTGG